MTEWFTASTERREIRSEATTGPFRERPGKMTPAGDVHAYDPEEGVTACGVPIADALGKQLVMWPDLPFADRFGRKCPRCNAAVAR